MLSRNYDYDFIILGGGSAGIVAGVVAGGAGLRTLLIEKSRMGGQTLNTGCIPSKALLHAAHVAHQMRTADSLGLKPAPLSREDAAGVLRHVRGTLDVVEEADATMEQLRKHNVEIRIGNARFISPDALELVEHEGPTRLLTAEHFLLATGSSPARPDIPGLAEAGYLTGSEIFHLEEIPETLIVIGGDSVGVEMAQAFARLGSQVTLIDKGPRLLPNDDHEVAETLEKTLRSEGIDVRTGWEARSVRLEAGRKVVRVEQDGFGADVSVAEILMAAGRTPRVEGLDLEAARVEYDAKGVQVNARLHTTSPRIWACGDIVGRYQFSHMAEYESKLVVRNILYPFDQKVDPGFKLAPWATFTDPETAHVGLTEEEAQSKGIHYQVFHQSFRQNDRALTEEESVGFVKVLAAGWQGKILGAHIIGPRAGELIQEWIQAMTQGLTMRQVADTIHVYPTLSMANQHAATRWSEAQGEKPLVKRTVEAYSRAVRPNLGKIVWGLAGVALLTGGALLAQRLSREKE